jgi:hypothetical protein
MLSTYESVRPPNHPSIRWSTSRIELNRCDGECPAG